MSEQLQHNDPLPQETAEPDMLALIKKMQQQLVSLEKKVDILVNQSQTRYSKDKYFSNAGGAPDRNYRRFDRERHNTYAEKSFSSGAGRHFEKRHGEVNRDSRYNKKSYGNPRESDSGQGHNFKKRYSGVKRGFGPSRVR